MSKTPGPSYYQFPGGHEVRHISAHLSGFGSQMVQYVARSTRLDGDNKGDLVDDLKKTIMFAEWEIERLEALEAQAADRTEEQRTEADRVALDGFLAQRRRRGVPEEGRDL